MPDKIETSPGMVEVRVEDRLKTDEVLEKAILTVTAAAIRNQIGIMITPIGPDLFVVRAHPAVPHGFVRQQRQ